MNRLASLLVLIVAMFSLPVHGQQHADAAPALLTPADIDRDVPAKVYFSGQSATTQLRNAGGVRWTTGKQSLFSLVDSSGYSTGLRERYQFYILTDVPILIAGQRLAPGAYGAGFVEGTGIVIMDMGSNELFHAPIQADAAMKRPRPLQILAGTRTGEFRLALGRQFVTFSAAK